MAAQGQDTGTATSPYHVSPELSFVSSESSVISPVSSYRVRRSGSDSTECTRESAWKRPLAAESPGHLSGCCKEEGTSIRDAVNPGGCCRMEEIVIYTSPSV